MQQGIGRGSMWENLSVIVDLEKLCARTSGQILAMRKEFQ